MRWICFGIGILLAMACIRQEPESVYVHPGDRLPSFRLVMEDGSTLQTEDLLGAPSLLIFFNTTCRDCQKTLPLVQKAYMQFGSKVKFVAISREQPAGEVRSWWNQNGITLPFSAQEDRMVYNLFASSRIPRIYISDQEGVVREMFDDNPCPTYEVLEQALNDVLVQVHQRRY